MDRCRPRWLIDLSPGSDDTLLDLGVIRCWLRQNIRRGYKTGACNDPLSRGLGARITVEVARDADAVMIRMAFAEQIISSVDPSGERRWHGSAAKTVENIRTYRSVLGTCELPDPAIGTLVYDTITGSMTVMTSNGWVAAP